MSYAHRVLPQINHDERAEQLFVMDLKKYVIDVMEPHQARVSDRLDAELGQPDDKRPVFRELMTTEGGRSWAALKQRAQDMMWEAVTDCVDRQLPALQAAGQVEGAAGSVTVDPDFAPPRYASAIDIHLMPGGYSQTLNDADVRQGAIYECGGAIYSLGRTNTGLGGAVKADTILRHIKDHYPDFAPTRILELGCTAGQATTTVALAYPEAEVHAVDIGEAILRYAHARAESLGAKVHFSQQNAEHTNFPDESFDLVFSSILLHETSAAALPKIFAECRRLLKPGGLMVHLEVPHRLSDVGLWSKMRAEFEVLYNNEPFWRGANGADLLGVAEGAGFKDVLAGYQPAGTGGGALTPKPQPGVASWYMVSALK